LKQQQDNTILNYTIIIGNQGEEHKKTISELEQLKLVCFELQGNLSKSSEQENVQIECLKQQIQAFKTENTTLDISRNEYKSSFEKSRNETVKLKETIENQSQELISSNELISNLNLQL